SLRSFIKNSLVAFTLPLAATAAIATSKFSNQKTKNI
ncbi:hypothetical protein NT04LM_0300, partial [Listeria monocytogenes FSL F2-208]